MSCVGHAKWMVIRTVFGAASLLSSCVPPSRPPRPGVWERERSRGQKSTSASISPQRPPAARLEGRERAQRPSSPTCCSLAPNKTGCSLKLSRAASWRRNHQQVFRLEPRGLSSKLHLIESLDSRPIECHLIFSFFRRTALAYSQKKVLSSPTTASYFYHPHSAITLPLSTLIHRRHSW